MSRYELAAGQVLLMAEQYAREQNSEVLRFPGSKVECSLVGVIIPQTGLRPFRFDTEPRFLPPVRLDDEHYQTVDVIWKVATRVIPDNSLGAAAIRSWEEKLAGAEAKGDEDAAALLRKDLAELWEELRKPPILRNSIIW